MVYVNYHSKIIITGLIPSESCVAVLGISLHIMGVEMICCEIRPKELRKLVSAPKLFPLVKHCVAGNSGLHGQLKSSADPPSFPRAQLLGIWTRPTWQPYSGVFL